MRKFYSDSHRDTLYKDTGSNIRISIPAGRSPKGHASRKEGRKKSAHHPRRYGASFASATASAKLDTERLHAMIRSDMSDIPLNSMPFQSVAATP